LRRKNKEEQGTKNKNKTQKTKKKRNPSKLDHKEIASNSHVMASVWKENNFQGLYKLQMRKQKIEKLLKALMQDQTPGRNCKSYLRGAVCKVAMAQLLAL
jgi:hypothetical protein